MYVVPGGVRVKKKRGARVGGEGSPTRTHIYKNEHVNCDECSLLFLLFIFFFFRAARSGYSRRH